ncbi:SUF system FeS cluster assembly SufBD superfamily [Arabidopsis thaliana x Arabidopsis arenosa]|uniref:SUF system FeS cluster assembly SufBD superfamily n=1 Tax=Arabidopsis thaliana x Arabidopsis arenosa TaxID=1240361 RepID=A0A8T2C326_9BRAS|nr:SUF system FeS cluster assembly SufBD superfamily [Arabidopsis thaliana x Arabidopsis arenosa]
MAAATVLGRLSLIPNLSSKPKLKSNRRTTSTSVSIRAQASFSDPFVLQLAESLEDSLSASPSSSSLPLQRIRDSSAETLLSTPWPSRKDEPFRFTDTSFIRFSQIEPVSTHQRNSEILDNLTETQFPNAVIIDGFVSSLTIGPSDLPDGVYFGSFSGLPDELTNRVSEFIGNFDSGDLFWSINGMGAPDLMVIYVPEGCKVEKPIYLRYFCGETGDRESKRLPVSNPRVFVLVEEGGEIGIVEEFVGKDEEGFYWTNPVLEVVVQKNGKLKHSYLQKESMASAHVKWTFVRQEAESEYELVEVSTGGKLGRHNVHVQQLGPDTLTELTTFHMCVNEQTLDLHSKIVLDHPRGSSRQLHKCIVAHSSGQAVFDGNVRVNRLAQQTNAGQLTRSLLLKPRATVNIKPNLQIIADDVKCSHGAAISDLEEDQLFYFQARGIDLETARRALISSFGSEVIEKFPNREIRDQARNHVKGLL